MGGHGSLKAATFKRKNKYITCIKKKTIVNRSM